MEHVSALLVTKLLFGFILKESSERKKTQNKVKKTKDENKDFNLHCSLL